MSDTQLITAQEVQDALRDVAPEVLADLQLFRQMFGQEVRASRLLVRINGELTPIGAVVRARRR